MQADIGLPFLYFFHVSFLFSAQDIRLLGRVVLAAEIVNKFNEEPAFGHIKFQNLFYLSEQVLKRNKFRIF
jgi:hypothetical protein